MSDIDPTTASQWGISIAAMAVAVWGNPKERMRHKERLAKINSRAEEMEGRIASLEDGLSSAKKKLEALEADRDRWKNLAEDLQDRLQSVEAQSEVDQGRIADLQSQLDEALSKLATAQADLDAWREHCGQCESKAKGEAKAASKKGGKRAR